MGVLLLVRRGKRGGSAGGWGASEERAQALAGWVSEGAGPAAKCCMTLHYQSLASLRLAAMSVAQEEGMHARVCSTHWHAT